MAYEYVIHDKEAVYDLVNTSRADWEQYLIVDGSLKNHEEDGKITGFALAIRLCWYRSFALTLIERIELMIDGQLIPREAIRFRVEGSDREYRLDEIGEAQCDEYWYLNKYGCLTVDRPGGLSAGPHEVEALLELFVTYHAYRDASYMKKIMRIGGEEAEA